MLYLIYKNAIFKAMCNLFNAIELQLWCPGWNLNFNIDVSYFSIDSTMQNMLLYREEWRYYVIILMCPPKVYVL